MTLTLRERWVLFATPQAITDAVEHRLRRWLSLRFPQGARRKTDLRRVVVKRYDSKGNRVWPKKA